MDEMGASTSMTEEVVISPTPPTALSASDLIRYYKDYVKAKRKVHGQRVERTHDPRVGLRVACYNLHFHQPYDYSSDAEGGPHLEHVIQKELQADVVCLQEVISPEDVTGMQYVHFHDLGHVGNAICSRYPLKDTVSYNYSQSKVGGRGLCAATVTHPTLGEFRIYNTHLDAFDDTETVRFRQASHIETIMEMDREKYKFTGPMLLMGDFNAMHRASYVDEAHWRWIQRQDVSRAVESKTIAMDVLLESGKWVDLFASNPPPVTTWSMRRIDFILARSETIDSTKFSIHPWLHFTIASDHLPVGVDILLQGSL